MTKIAPFGTWKSPITSDLIVSESIRLPAVVSDGEDIYWLEGRPAEGGRTVLVRRTPEGTVADITPQPFNVRSRVHEYGGGAFLVDRGTIYFSNDCDRRLYRQTPGSAPEAITPESQRRYADIICDRPRNRLICICEDYSRPDIEPENLIVAIALDSGVATTLVSGCDFYSSPRLSPDGSQLAWLEWNHPDLPWDATRLQIAPVEPNGMLGTPTCVAGGESESVLHPKWSPDGTLYFASDRSNWWNLYRWSGSESECLLPMAAEFAYPHWIFGLSVYAFLGSDRLICTYTQNGRWYLATLDVNTKQLHPIDVPYTDIASLDASGDRAVFVAGSPTEPTAVVQLNLATGEREILKRSLGLELDAGYLSVPEAIAFPTENQQTAYAWFYPPTNKDCAAPDSERPPVLVKSHGGPTAATSTAFNLRIQYWTSRGFAYLDVNYGGSTGYGREYRDRLHYQWGVVDVLDCINAAKYLADRGQIDSDRAAITGGSAGGYTTLAALTFHDFFKAGASHYGVSDLEALLRDTHKFEARYFDRLVGPYPETRDTYRARSPIHHVQQLATPVAFFQGLEDKVVPPNQAEMMVEGLKAKGLPVAYIPFAGEQHGFRRAESIKRALDGEFYFYSRIFGFQPAETLTPVEILNLPAK